MFLDALATAGVVIFLASLVVVLRRNRKKVTFGAAFPAHALYAGLAGTLWLVVKYYGQ